MSELKVFGTAHGGRFLVCGSAAEDRIKFDSDLDVIVDFPTQGEAEAVDFVEDICRRQNLPADVHVKSKSSSRFFDRIRDDMVPLP